MLHDENHPAPKVVDGRIIDQDKVAVDGEDTLENEAKKELKKFQEEKAAPAGAAGPFFPATKAELEEAAKAPTDRVWKTDLKINDLNFASILLAAKKEKHEALYRAAVTSEKMKSVSRACSGDAGRRMRAVLWAVRP